MKMIRTKKPKNTPSKPSHNFPKSSDYSWWENRASYSTNSTPGRPPKFQGPEELWQACCEYFEWVSDNPLYDYKTKGKSRYVKIQKPRPFTLTGLCLFLGFTSLESWRYYRKHKPEFLGVIKRVENIIYCQKFEGAAVGFFNPNIIARDLGLKNREEVSGHKENPKETQSNYELDFSKLTDEELVFMSRMLNKMRGHTEEDKSTSES